MPDHTPGPWVFIEEYGVILGSTDQWICDIPLQNNDSQHRANINLILAAPNLLMACQAVSNAMASPRIDSKDRSLFEQLTDACNQCILALEKATTKEANFEK